MISQDVVVRDRGGGGRGRGRSASMKGHAVPKAVDEILIERRTGLTVDVADGDGGRPWPPSEEMEICIWQKTI